jgi:hypothetical protein
LQSREQARMTIAMEQFEAILEERGEEIALMSWSAA